MPEIEPHLADDGTTIVDPRSPRTALFWDGTHWHVPRVDAAGHLQIDVAASTVPGGIATAANQIAIHATLGVIDNLVNALQSAPTDRLIVRGEDQLFSIDHVLAFRTTDTISGAGGWIASAGPAAGEIWVVTSVFAADQTSAVTRIQLANRQVAVNAFFHDEARAFAADDTTQWAGHLYLNTTCVLRAWFTGGLAGDVCIIDVNGYAMTLEV